MRKKKKTRSGKRPFTLEKGKNPEKTSEKRKNLEKKKKKKPDQRRGPLHQRRGRTQKKKKSKTERERRTRPEWVALKCRRGTMGRWIGFRSEWVTLWPGSCADLGLNEPRSCPNLGLAQTSVSHGPRSRSDLGCFAAWVSRGGAMVR